LYILLSYWWCLLPTIQFYHSRVDREDRANCTMPFWGSSEKTIETPKDFTSSDEAGYNSSSVGYGGSSGGGGSSTADLEQFSVALQQSMLVQTIISNLTETAFERCITGRPGDSLGGKEVACIHASVNKMMDTNEFMMGRLAKKQSQSGGF
jgi:mitochondrial import inner membrane translocase subunit TIM8